MKSREKKSRSRLGRFAVWLAVFLIVVFVAYQMIARQWLDSELAEQSGRPSEPELTPVQVLSVAGNKAETQASSIVDAGDWELLLNETTGSVVPASDTKHDGVSRHSFISKKAQQALDTLNDAPSSISENTAVVSEETIVANETPLIEAEPPVNNRQSLRDKDEAAAWARALAAHNELEYLIYKKNYPNSENMKLLLQKIELLKWEEASRQEKAAQLKADQAAVAAAQHKLNIIRKQLVTDIQTQLLRLGYPIGTVDGQLGRRSVEAIKHFEKGSGLMVTGVESESLLLTLKKTKEKPVLPGDVIIGKKIPGIVLPEMVLIPAGQFEMGCVSAIECEADELPVHQVTIAAFLLAKTEVTFAQYDTYTKATGVSRASDLDWGRGQQPVISVSYDDAQAYADWLSEQTGERYYLPSEAQWEYAARAGSKTPFSTGKCITTDQANYDGSFDFNDCGSDSGVFRQRPSPVASYRPNAFGLYDMHGNVYEWTQDCWSDNYNEAPVDGSAREEGDCERGVLRGGSWYHSPKFLRSALRNVDTRSLRYHTNGFRLAKDV
jgi:serine/threonine-protein kinase